MLKLPFRLWKGLKIWAWLDSPDHRSFLNKTIIRVDKVSMKYFTVSANSKACCSFRHSLWGVCGQPVGPGSSPALLPQPSGLCNPFLMGFQDCSEQLRGIQSISNNLLISSEVCIKAQRKKTRNEMHLEIYSNESVALIEIQWAKLCFCLFARQT